MGETIRGQRSRQAIIAAAAELITSEGVQQTSMAEISATSKVSTGAIYHHFPNKAAIVVEVAKQTLAWPHQALLEYADRPAAPEMLFKFAIETLISDHSLGNLLLQLGAGAGTDDDLGRALRAEFTPLRLAVQDSMNNWAKLNGVPATNVEKISQLLSGLVLGFADQQVLLDCFDEKAYLSQGQALLKRAVSTSNVENLKH